MTLYSVKGGIAPTLIMQQVPSGGVSVRNTDQNNGVWVDKSSSVTPGSGVFLDAQASFSWDTEGVPLYACVDTGVNGSVTLDVSADVSGISDPLAIATATALKILQNGVPLVQSSTSFLNNTNSIKFSGNGSSPVYNVTQYQSIQLEGGIISSAIGDQYALNVLWLDPNNTAVVIGCDSFTFYSIGSNQFQNFVINLNTKSPAFKLSCVTNNKGGSSNYLFVQYGYGYTVPVIRESIKGADNSAYNTTQLLAYQTGILIGPATSSTIYGFAPPAGNLVNVYYNKSATANIAIDVTQLLYGGASGLIEVPVYGANSVSTAYNTVIQGIAVARWQGLKMTITNNDTVNRQPTFALVDSSA